MKFKFSVLFISFLIILGVFGRIPREDFWQSFILYSLLYGLYLLLCFWATKMNLNIGQVMLLALLARLVFVGIPLHSDDYYRFLWDGQLILHQINPYEYSPRELMEMGEVPHVLIPIYDALNSPYYHSIYPVTNQSVFAFAAWAGGQKILGFVLGIRFILVFFEMISIWILYRILTKLKKDPSQTLLYALNPLILLEITGNLHFEGVMVSFIFLGLWSLLHSHILKAGGWIGAAISIKLTPLILIPLFLKNLGLSKFLGFISVVMLVCGLFFLPIVISGTFSEFLTSVQLYYGTFEFNASIYYLLRELGYLIKGYNMIASISLGLSLSVFILICYTSWKAKIENIHQLIFYSITAYFIYLILSMVVHPWYIIPLVGLGIIIGMKYPLVWAYLIYLSYHAYGVEPYRENYSLLGVQYGLLALIVVWEYAEHLSPNILRYNRL